MFFPQSAHIHLGKLCNRLLSSFSLRQLRQLATDLGLDAHFLGFSNPALKKEAVVTMVARINELQRLDDLLAICVRWNASFTAIPMDFPIEDWTPRPLPSAIIEIANRALGWKGQPYQTVALPTDENRGMPEPAETGCYDWPLNQLPFQEPLSAEPGFYDMLIRVREAIVEEEAFAYLSIERTWGELGKVSIRPCIVVAPTVVQFDSILIEQTEGGKSDLGPPEIIDVLRSLDARYGLDILAVGMGAIEFKVTNMTNSQKASFSRWLKAFAPEVYREYKFRTNQQLGHRPLIRLWWD